MSEDSLLPFELPSVARKKLSVGFDGGQLSSDAGVLVLRGVEKKLGLAARLASCIRDRRKPERIEHSFEEMLRLRMFAIAAGYEDANDCDALRHDPVFKMAVGHAPESGDPLCSQQVKSWQWHLEMRHNKYKRKIETDTNHTTRCILHEIDVKNINPGEALNTYYKLIDGKL